MAAYDISNKVTNLEEAVSLIKNGDKTALGGALSLREPM